MPLPLGVLANVSAGGAVATSDYELLETTQLAGTATEVIFSGLGTYSNYKHLQIRYVAKATSTVALLHAQFNSDTNGPYITHRLIGNGTAGSSNASSTSDTTMRFDFGVAESTSNLYGVGIIDIYNYASTVNNTTVRVFNGLNAATSRVGLQTAAFFDTSAITSIRLFPSTGNFAIGSRFSLYGIKG
jgi:hypothetical protein